MRLGQLAIASAMLLMPAAPGGVALAQDAAGMTFFVSSVGGGDGGNLGGLEGADALCTRLAEAAGAGGKEWRAYLSATGVNARDRIGPGPWQNFRGHPIALTVDNLHSDSDNFTKFTALTELGEMVPGFGDETNTHDILTGSNDDGTLAEGMTCNDWTSNDDTSVAMVGHSDEGGPPQFQGVESWNSAHQTQGCSQASLARTGGAGQIYCFAVSAP